MPRPALVRVAADHAAALARASQLRDRGDLDAAAAVYREILAAEPEHERALFSLGLVEHLRGDHAAARARFERVIALVPGVAEYHLWFGRVLQVLGQSQAALAEIRRSRELAPHAIGAVITECQLLREQNQLDAALELLRPAVAAAPGCALLHATLGEILLVRKEPALARSALERALELDGSLCEAWINLALALHAQKHSEAATLAYEQALRLQPDQPDAHYNLAATLENINLLDRALAHAIRAVELRPHIGAWQTVLAKILSELGECEEAVSMYRSGLELSPTSTEHSSLVALHQYLPIASAHRLAEARAWAERYAKAPDAALGTGARAARTSAGGRMRVGYISADFREHSVSYFFEPLLAAHDPERVQVTCYASSTHRDAVTERLSRLARMRPVAHLSDEQLAEQIRMDGIDVLVDLAGHTLGHRLSVFAHETAPVKLAYLGYPGTTGVPEIQWRITDAHVDPAPLADACYSERLYRLPRAFCSFRPPVSPEVTPLPAAARGHLTFGSLNKYMKISEPTLRAWTQILGSLPDSRLVLQSRIFADAGSCARVRRRFAERGVAPERLDLRGALPLSEHMKLYGEIDIGLDTQPWNGHTTSCLALHMGVPVLALAGDVGASRMGVSVLTAAGLPDWIARDEASYVASAVRWASELGALAELRRGLRDQLARSELGDAESLARCIEDAYADFMGRG